MTGIVSPELQAAIRIEVQGPQGQAAIVEAQIDTGFDGDLLLPSIWMDMLGLPEAGACLIRLADGRVAMLAIYDAVALFGGEPRLVQVLAGEGGPLLGMHLMKGQKLTIEIVDGGSITLIPLDNEM